MGREVRRVPPGWQHPKEGDRYIPLLDQYNEHLEDWVEGKSQWDKGYERSYKKDGPRYEVKDEGHSCSYEEWAGESPDPKDYMPDFPQEERTHWQMYESTSEGTPISPVMESPESLARWLVDNQASAFGSQTATYEAWLNTIMVGWAPSGIAVAGQAGS